MILALTLGDVGGIGPEIVMKCVFRHRWPADLKFVIIGSRSAVRELCRLCGLNPPPEWKPGQPIPRAKAVFWDPVDMRVDAPYLGKRPPCVGLCPGKIRVSSARGAALWIHAAVQGCMEGFFDGMVTGPVCKDGFRRAGIPFPGHTEFLANLTGARRVGMMLMGGGLRVVLVTRHLALRDVPAAVTLRSVCETVVLAAEAAEWLGLDGRLAVCALNPHAGDGGALGDEEKTVLKPAVRRLRARGIDARGPIPADVVFYQALRGESDIVVSMYHDQGLGPLKMLGFEKGVNLTLGLPLVRTSPDHGTALDIAGRGQADASSMIEAVKCAASLAGRSTPWHSEAGSQA